MLEYPHILCLSGLDPSAGAGLLADVRAVEANGGTPLGIATGITVQNHSAFIKMRWEKEEDIIESIKALKKHDVKAIKVGIIESFMKLETYLKLCKAQWPNAKIVWDPIVESSSGYTFLKEQKWREGLSKLIHLTTPNLPEQQWLRNLNWKASPFVLVKGGHSDDASANDELFENNQLLKTYTSIKVEGEEKRGTGCILSATIATWLGKNNSMEMAIEKGKNYITQYYKSTPEKVGRYFNEKN